MAVLGRLGLDRLVLEKAIRSGLRDLGAPEQRTGILAALGSGVAISMAVARFFIGLGGPNSEAFGFALPLAAIAFVFTTAGTFLAVRASSTPRAVLWVLAANVLPPTILCAPTVIGLFYSVPSGFISFAIVLPLALLARWSAARERPGARERDALLGGAFSGLFALVLLGVEAVEAPHGSAFEPLPALAAGLAALGLCGWAFARDAHRDWMVRAIGGGRVPGWRVHPPASGSVILERAVDVGDGPLRAGTAREIVGELTHAPLRTTFGMMLTASAATLVGFAVLALAA